MITSLTLRNFKAWANTGDVRLAPITGLFGTNSSGKTSILQLLLILKQTVESTDRAQVFDLGDDRSLVDVGSFNEVVRNHDDTLAVEWSLCWTLNDVLRIADPERSAKAQFELEELCFIGDVGELGSRGSPRTVVRRFEYRFEDRGRIRSFGMKRRKANEYELITEGFDAKRFRGRAWPLPAPSKFYGFPDQVFGYYRNVEFLADLQLRLEQTFTNLFYLGPLREFPKRQYIWAGSQPSDMGRRGERAIDALLASRDRGASISRGQGRRRMTLEQVVAFWLQQLGLVQSFQVRPIARNSNLYQVYIRQYSKASEALITDVGFGVSQILPVLVLCYYVPEGSTIVLEQPEIHLHPAVASGLADVLIDAIKTRHVQIILESHSEHLLRRLQRRIAEQRLQTSDVALYFCSAHDQGSSITGLAVDLFGNISNWPDGFFGDELGELAAMTKASMQRQLEATA